jgi:hypothetical protein
MSNPKIDRTLDLAVLGLVSAAVASLAIWVVPFSNPSPRLLDEARAVVATSRMTMPFFQTGYIGLLALGLWLGGLGGVFFLNAVAYVVSVFLAYALVTVAGGRPIAALLAALLVAAHPYMAIDIKRIADNNLAIPSLLGLALVVVWAWRVGDGIRVVVMAGLIAGIAVVTRSNFAPVIVLALWPLLVRHRFADAAMIVAIALSLVLTTNRSLTGHWRLTPTEGSYTFYIGANQFTANSLLREYNSEGSFEPALKADNVDLDGMDPYVFADAHPELFWRLGFRYIADHPVKYIGLGLLKVLTTFRPDYRLLATSKTAPVGALIVVQTGLALIAVLWIATRIYQARTIGVFDGLLAIPIAVLLLGPIFLFNGDPRFRRPIEVIAIADTVWCWDAWLKSRRGYLAPGEMKPPNLIA